MQGRKAREEIPGRPDFGYWLRESRRAVRLSQAELGKLVGLSNQYISNLENNRANTVNGLPSQLSAEKIVALAEAMNLDPDNALVLFGFTPRMQGSGSVVISSGNVSKIMQMDGSEDSTEIAIQRLLCEAQRFREAADELERTAQNLRGR